MRVAHVIADTTFSASSIQLSRHIRIAKAQSVWHEENHSIARRGSDIDAVLSALHDAHHSVPMVFSRDPLTRQRLYKCLKGIQPDICLSYHRHGAQWLTHLHRSSSHIARVTESQHLGFYRQADAWIANTLSLYHRLARIGVPRNRLFHAYNLPPAFRPTPPSDIAALRALYHLEDDWVMMSIAPLSANKGHELMLEALSRLPDEIHRRRWCWMVVGNGPLKGELQRQAKRLDIEHKIIWCPQVLDVRPYLHLADVLVHSGAEQENFGHGILEAWRYNIPLVLTHFIGAQEITSHRRDCLHVPQNDSNALASALTLLLCQSDLRTQLVIGGHETLHQYFSTPTLLARYNEIFHDVMRLQRRQSLAST